MIQLRKCGNCIDINEKYISDHFQDSDLFEEAKYLFFQTSVRPDLIYYKNGLKPLNIRLQI